LHELINRGGAAEIWMATNEANETCAVRRLYDCGFFDFAARKQFVRGCEILAQIHGHSHIIGYLEHGKLEGTPYLVMEYVEGANLKQLFARNDDVLMENVSSLLIDMAVALEHVHDRGFMHLDFKPENVMVTRNASVRLVDFDLAQPKPAKPVRLAGNAGTPAYMAPEQLRREPLDHRADIFSFGVSAYELLTYKRPFVGDTPEEVLRRQLDEKHEVVRPRLHNPDIPIALERAVLKCLARNPDDRYQDMSFLVRDLQAALYKK